MMNESVKLLNRIQRVGKMIFNENMVTASMVLGDQYGEEDGTVNALGQPPVGVARQSHQQPGFQTMMQVTGYKDMSAKDLLGIGTEFMVDTTTNPMMTNLLDQDGSYVCLDDIKDFFHFEPVGMDPKSDSSGPAGTDMMHSREN